MVMHAHTHARMNFFLRSPPKAPLRNLLFLASTFSLGFSRSRGHVHFKVYYIFVDLIVVSGIVCFRRCALRSSK